MKDLEFAKNILRIIIKRDRSENTLKLSQSSYLHKAFKIWQVKWYDD